MNPPRAADGYSLLEVALVLAISAILMSGLTGAVSMLLRTAPIEQAEITVLRDFQNLDFWLKQDANAGLEFTAGQDPVYGTFQGYELSSGTTVRVEVKYYFDDHMIMREEKHNDKPFALHRVADQIQEYGDVTLEYTPDTWTYSQFTRDWTYTESKVSFSVKATVPVLPTPANPPDAQVIASIIAQMRPQSQRDASPPGNTPPITPAPNQLNFLVDGEPTILQGILDGGSKGAAALEFDDTDYYIVEAAGTPPVLAWEVTSEVLPYTELQEASLSFTARSTKHDTVVELFIYNPDDPSHTDGGYDTTPDDETVYPIRNVDNSTTLLLSAEDVAFLSSTVRSTPTVSGSVVFVGSDHNKVVALSATSSAQLWSYTTAGRVRSSPTVDGGRVYVGSDDNNLYALDAATGSLVWSFPTGGKVQSSPVVSGDTVYVGSDDAEVYALSTSTGTMIWSFSADGAVASSPTVSGGMVYVGSDDAKVYALNETTGAEAWSYTTGAQVKSSPVVSGGKVYVGSDDKKVYALDASTGALAWSTTTSGVIRSSPAVSGGTVYVGSDDNNVYALDASTGSLDWSYTTGGKVRSSPVVSGSRVYVGSTDKKVYALNASTGALTWSYETGEGVESSPTESGGAVFIGSDDRKVYALDATAGTLDWSFQTGDLPTRVIKLKVRASHLLGTQVVKLKADRLVFTAAGEIAPGYQAVFPINSDDSPIVLNGTPLSGSGTDLKDADGVFYKVRSVDDPSNVPDVTWEAIFKPITLSSMASATISWTAQTNKNATITQDFYVFNLTAHGGDGYGSTPDFSSSYTVRNEPVQMVFSLDSADVAYANSQEVKEIRIKTVARRGPGDGRFDLKTDQLFVTVEP